MYSNNTTRVDHTESLLENLVRRKDAATTSKTENETMEEKELNKDGRKILRLLSNKEAPEYLTHNTYILGGYRGILNTKMCLESVFWWTNETINIWSHLFGFMLFFGLTLYDLSLLNVHASFTDKLIVAVLLICFQITMCTSALYHIFSCRSEHDFNCFLTYDLFGIALALLAIYMSGVYYAFWCHQDIQQFYLITVILIFVIAMLAHLPRFNLSANVKMAVFVGWAIYGVIPTLHWTIHMGGFANPLVSLLIPRVFGMYIISGVAFFFYLSKVPERFSAGKFDFLGHSHQWWHLIVVFALYYWHNSGMIYVEYRMNHACSDSRRFMAL